jgi:hypothetical protein
MHLESRLQNVGALSILDTVDIGTPAGRGTKGVFACLIFDLL